MLGRIQVHLAEGPTRNYCAETSARLLHNSLLLRAASRARIQRFLIICVLALAPARLLLAPGASADAGVVLNESLDTSVARITGSGHSAIYLSNICPDNSPVKMRLCRPGEQGSVLSNYTTLGEDQPYEWNIVPLSIYLYGVEDPSNRPLVSSKAIKALLEERYRENYLAQMCTSEKCLKSNSAEWREMVAATLERSLYMFVVKTTVERDRALIAEFNSLPNVNHFNGMTNNCADFTRRVLDIYYPHSVKPDYINDFFMASPKAAARTFTHYAQEHPELDLRVLHFSQVPGTIKRSSECRSGTEQLYHSKKLVIPLAVFAWQSVPIVTASYMITGRFNPEHQFEAHPSMEALGADDDSAGTGAAPRGYTVSVQQLEAEQRLADDSIVGSKDEWKDYRDQFNDIVEQAIHDELIPNRGYLKHVFKRLGAAGKLSVDANGALWINWTDSQPAGRVGLSASNIFATDSDAQIAYQILLARVEAELNSPKHSRETMIEFKRDWAMTVELHAAGSASLARKNAGVGAAGAAATQSTEPAGSPSAPASGTRFGSGHLGHGTLP
ncbi:MAG: hypothetical protein WA867_16000 [Candidatus Acidiferrales bacterium]